jgi:hypothetical protein
MGLKFCIFARSINPVGARFNIVRINGDGPEFGSIGTVVTKILSKLAFGVAALAAVMSFGTSPSRAGGDALGAR